MTSTGKAAEEDTAYIDARQTLRQAGHLMRELGVGALKVRGENGDPQGTISSDMVVRRIAAGGDPRTVTVGEMASAAPTRRRAIAARTLAAIGLLGRDRARRGPCGGAHAGRSEPAGPVLKGWLH